jgi:hypothetical protein
LLTTTQRPEESSTGNDTFADVLHKFQRRLEQWVSCTLGDRRGDVERTKFRPWHDRTQGRSQSKPSQHPEPFTDSSGDVPFRDPPACVRRTWTHTGEQTRSHRASTGTNVSTLECV